MKERKCRYCKTILKENYKHRICEACIEKWKKNILPLILKSSDNLLEQRKFGKRFRKRLEFWKVVDIDVYNKIIEENKQRHRDNAKRRYWMMSDEDRKMKREYQRRYRDLNREKIKEYYKKYYLNKKENQNGRKEIMSQM